MFAVTAFEQILTNLIKRENINSCRIKSNSDKKHLGDNGSCEACDGEDPPRWQ